MHHLTVKPERRPLKQALRRLHPNLAAFDIEVDKLVKDVLVRYVQYPIWLPNIVSVKEKRANPLCISLEPEKSLVQ